VSIEGLAYTDTGAGTPVVLLHGLTCNAAYWLRVSPLLEGLRVIALDFRGHGLSRHRESYAYPDYEGDLLSVIDELGLERVTVAGHSLGGCSPRHAATASPPCSPRTSRATGRRRTRGSRKDP
jgi:pimeloyl-ACP methyl ester carboxylesterase